MMAEVIVVNNYQLRDGAGFEAAVAALVARVRDKGHPGVRSYRFFRPTPDMGRAVVTYDGPEAWVGHHDIIMGWPEMAALRRAADLTEIEYNLCPAPTPGSAEAGRTRRVRSPKAPVETEPPTPEVAAEPAVDPAMDAAIMGGLDAILKNHMSQASQP